MSHEPSTTHTEPDLFQAARAYDESINWNARIEREIPVLCDVFGPPGTGGILDAGCGTAHQAIELATRGYSVTGADKNDAMLAVARTHAEKAPAAKIEFVHADYADLETKTNGGFDGLFCQGNALAAAGTRDAVAEAINQFARCLKPGGTLFVQILNFKPLCEEIPCVRGPRVSTSAGIEYVSVREFHRDGERIQVTNISLWREDGKWSLRSNCGYLYPVAPDEMRTWLAQSGLELRHTWGGYNRAEFDPASSVDLIIVATRR